MIRKVFISLLLVMSCGLPAAEAQDVIAVRSYNVRQYDEALTGFKRACDCNVRELALSEDNGPHLLSEVNRIKPSLVFAIGAEALSLVSETNMPVVYAMVLRRPRAVSQKENISGINMEIPIELQLEEFQAALPNVRRIGLVYDSRKTSAGMVKSAALAAKTKGITLVTREVSSPQKVLTAINTMRDEIDVFWMLPDSTVVTPETVEFILLNSIEKGLPVITFSPKYVEMGALLSFSMDAFDVGRQAGMLARGILNGEDAASLPAAQAGRLILSINLKAAKHLGVVFNDNIVKRARIVNK